MAVRYEEVASGLMREYENEQPEPKPPSRVWRLLIVWAAFSCNFILSGHFNSFTVFFWDLKNDFNASFKEMRWLGLLLPVFALLLGPLTSALVNKHGFRLVVITGSALGGISYILALFSINIECLMVTYGIMEGIASGLIYLPVNILVAYYFEKMRALAMAIAISGALVGNYFMPLGSKILLVKYGWKGTLGILAANTLICGVWAIVMKPLKVSAKKRPSTPLYLRKDSDSTSGAILSNNQLVQSHNIPGNNGTPFTDFSILKNGLFWMINIFYAVVTIVVHIPVIIIISLAIEKELYFEFPVKTLMITSTCAILICGLLMSIPKLDSFLINNICLLLSGICLFLLPFANSTILLIVIWVLYSCFADAYFYLLPVVLVDRLGLPKLSAAFGWLMPFNALALIAGSQIADKIYNFKTSLNLFFFVPGALMVIIAILFILFIGVQRCKSKATRPQFSVELQGRRDDVTPI